MVENGGNNKNNQGYGKRPLWQWIAIYVIIAAVVYIAIYYVFLAKKGTSSIYTPTPQASPVQSTPEVQQTVTLTSDGFSPTTLTIKVGTTVTWVNQSGNGATINSNPHPVHTTYPPLNLGSFPNGGTLSLTFDKPGSYGYHNHLIPSQTGTIIVQ